tara:strand:- start:17819 stop:18133 length:315 start_codon:yes stop_codon:yes gene_type:complete
MSDECHTFFKQYSAMVGKPMSELMYEFTRQGIHQSAIKCKSTRNLLKANKIKLDKRVDKKCWSASCFWCEKEKACRVGVYGGGFVPNDFAKENLESPDEGVGSI